MIPGLSFLDTCPGTGAPSVGEAVTADNKMKSPWGLEAAAATPRETLRHSEESSWPGGGTQG